MLGYNFTDVWSIKECLAEKMKDPPAAPFSLRLPNGPSNTNFPKNGLTDTFPPKAFLLPSR